MTGLLLAALRWDPQIRGSLIVLTGIIVLVGSVYLLLATNTGARLGFVIAAAGLFGWMTVMGAVWTVFGIGIKGEEPSWKPLEVVSGDLSQSTVEAAHGFPNGWKPLPRSDPGLADAEAASDAVLSGEGGEEGGGEGGGEGGSEGGGEGGSEGGEGGGEEKLRMEPPFKSKSDYEMVEAFKKGGDTWLFTLRHRPHYVALQVKPSQSAPADQQGKPVTTVLMLRDLGNLRAPSFFFMVFSGILFTICASSLHQRDKAAMARQASVTSR
ncbi:MAG: hypothetical protein M3396_09760 [Actinomycetota bacterium]|nr:hypothetical protein [Actinomycetota bacterium]MDQ3575542.1 hypothetical protein [Actinomycetota bacterium]